VQSVVRVPGQDALVLRTQAHTYYVLLCPGKTAFPGGTVLSSDAAVAVLRDQDALALSGGTYLEATTPQGPRSLRLNERGNAWADRARSAATPCIQYDTCAGEDHPRDTRGLILSTAQRE
jgi:hypothetical protein